MAAVILSDLHCIAIGEYASQKVQKVPCGVFSLWKNHLGCASGGAAHSAQSLGGSGRVSIARLHHRLGLAKPDHVSQLGRPT